MLEEDSNNTREESVPERERGGERGGEGLVTYCLEKVLEFPLPFADLTLRQI